MNAVLATFIVLLIDALVSLIGVFFIRKSHHLLDTIFISFATGALLGNAFFQIYPTVIEQADKFYVNLALIGGFLLFFVFDKILRLGHFHLSEEEINIRQKKGTSKLRSIALLNMLGDGFHNTFDGAAIALSYLASFDLGLSTSISVIAHEIPQEIADFAILIAAGYGLKNALKWNFITSLTAFLGAFLVFAFVDIYNEIKWFLLSVVVGNFFYLAASALVPVLHEKPSVKEAIIQFIFILLGLATMLLIKPLLSFFGI